MANPYKYLTDDDLNAVYDDVCRALKWNARIFGNKCIWPKEMREYARQQMNALHSVLSRIDNTEGHRLRRVQHGGV